MDDKDSISWVELNSQESDIEWDEAFCFKTKKVSNIPMEKIVVGNVVGKDEKNVKVTDVNLELGDDKKNSDVWLDIILDCKEKIEYAVSRKNNGKIQFNTSDQSCVLKAVKSIGDNVTKLAFRISKLEDKLEGKAEQKEELLNILDVW